MTYIGYSKFKEIKFIVDLVLELGLKPLYFIKWGVFLFGVIAFLFLIHISVVYILHTAFAESPLLNQEYLLDPELLLTYCLAQ